ncbi:MAG TPA: hypothetical protein VMN35_04185 [Gaiellaceae bacterium]|nr:hypothetical protein [Gaiellaceae bacterium]
MRLGLFLALGMVLGAFALAVPDPAKAGPGLVVGAVEDEVRASSLVEAEAKMAVFRVSGFRAVRVTAYWLPGQSRPPEGELEVLRNVAQAGARHGVRVYVTVMSPGSATTPLSDEARSDFAGYAATIVREIPAVRDVIVGNEPNLNRFWLPQFAPDGTSAAPGAYLSLLGKTYDALKAVAPMVEVYGGAVSPRGTDRPDGIRPTHSPTSFIRALGVAYRASGRTTPIMDAFVIHPYMENSSLPPTTAHPHPLNTTITIADYDKLVTLLAEAFDGTAQSGSQLPILYGEFGVESQIPDSKRGLYTGNEPQTTRPVPEDTQAAYYEQALGMAFCQPNVVGMLLLHSQDERDLDRWQSGIRYVDGTPKPSLPRVKRALDRSVGGSIARCPGLELVVRPTFLRFGTRSAAKRGVFRTRVRCSLDCVYQLRLVRVDNGSVRLSRRGRLAAGELVRVDLGSRTLRPGTYRYTLRLVHPVNPASPTLRAGPQFRLP